MASDLREQLQGTLGESYVLEQELAGGGMSRVFVATDASLGRKVVVKVLPADMAAEVRIDRFRREIQLAANLQHPHIVPLLLAGETNGLPYFIMPFVRGESLRERLNKVGEFPITEAVRILREVASALAYAHENGIVHRDIKPENVLISGGSAMVTDFGVAKALRSASNVEPGSLTSVGVAIGTPTYMAPEQGTADPNTDHRADIYALGIVGYEMLVGSPPFSARSSQEMLAAHVTRKVEPVTERRATVPPVLARLIMNCLEKRPSDRPQSASEVMQQLDSIHIPGAGPTPEAQPFRSAENSLGSDADARPRLEGRVNSTHTRRWLQVGAVSAAIVLVLIMVWRLAPWRIGEAEDQTARPNMLAVLPFENLGRPENAYFADGVTEEVRGKLSNLSGLMVIARSSSAQYKQTTKPPQQIARELGVQYLLAGTIRTELGATGKPARVRVSPELIQVVNGAPVTRWQQAFDADVTDVFQVQAEIAERVVQSLDVRLGEGEHSRLAARPTKSLAAYDAYLQGEEASGALSAADPPSLQRAMRFYERAVALDSTFSQAFARLSRVRTILYVNTPTQQRVTGLAAAKRAIALSPERPEGRVALADYYMYVVRDLVRAGEQVGLALAQTPNNVDALGEAAAVAKGSGRWDESLSYARKAQALDPRSVGAASALGNTLTWLRRYDEARQALDHALALAPGDLGARHLRVVLELARGDLTAARGIIVKGKTPGNSADLIAFFAWVWDLGWVLDDADQRILLRLSPEGFGGDRGAWGSALAQVYALRGDKTRARAYADTARVAIEAAMRANRNDVGDLHVYRALTLAYMGDFQQAAEEGRRAVALSPISESAEIGPYIQHQLARVYILTGQPEKALDQLEPLLRIPYFLSPGWLRIDPTFTPLRGNPRFERLIHQ